MTRQELADAVGIPYWRAYYWTAKRGVVTPSYGESERRGDPAWFSPQDADDLRRFLEALDTVADFKRRGRPDPKWSRSSDAPSTSGRMR